jgi:hypothetical protein
LCKGTPEPKREPQNPPRRAESFSLQWKSNRVNLNFALLVSASFLSSADGRSTPSRKKSAVAIPDKPEVSPERAVALSERHKNELDQIHPGVAKFSIELMARLGALDPQRVDPDGRIRDAELASWSPPKALHAANAATADLVEQKRVGELVIAREHERACDLRRRQALLDVARMKLELQAARYQECITRTLAEVSPGTPGRSERFAQVYQATQRRPLVGFDAVAIALGALDVQMK